ncbi:MAG TPA: permease prefix domain 1-containing protein, partial [Pyrinomonadaceae bacterium]|nr:permease prefix domain 1-containing protein [Pyrinomonadaceae bacterium]
MQGRLFKRFDRDQIEREIDEELRLHIELLTQEHLQKDLSLTEATDAALKRFGSVERVKEQCVEISRSNGPLMRALKALLIPVFLFGVLLRV